MSSEPATQAERTAADRLIGEVLANRYRIEERLGEGAMGSVYKATHVKVGRAFAVKILHKRLLEDTKITQRFEREAELAGRLRHPNVVGVVDVGETDDGFRYMVMDFAEGDDLATLLGEAPMPPERVTGLVRQMLEGLYHAHEAGLIHRDFKPENVIVERDDHDTEVPRIVDFGIAILREGGDSSNSAGRLTTNGLVLGTPHYMAPEQAVADPIDHRIDLFALGIVIYEMLSGKLPFDGTGAEVARANLLLDPPPISQRVPYLEVDPLLEAFARRLMAKKRDHRPATAKAARELLDLVIHDRPAAALALGVPLIASSRTPAVTQPVSPQRSASESGDYMTSTPRAPSSAEELEAPAVSSVSITLPPAGTLAPPRAQALISTAMQEPVRRRRTWIIAAVGAFSVAALATVIVVKSMGDDNPAPRQVAVEAPVRVAKPPPPEPMKHKPPVVEVPPAGVKPPPPTILKKPPVVKKPPPPPQITVKPVAPETHELTVKKPDPPARLDVNALGALYGVVGLDLKTAAQISGFAAVAKIDERFRNLRLQSAGTQEKIDAMAAILNGMRVELAPLKKKP